jgi:hypothetical protein
MIGMTTIAPIAVMLVIFVTLIGFAYAETPDRVTIDSFPFEITMMEEGELTIINMDTVTHTFNLSGGFSHTVEAGEGLVFNLPDYMTADNTDGWYLFDEATGGYNIIHTEAVYVAPPQPVYVAPVYVEPTPEPVVAEPLEVVTTSTGINNVATYDGDVDALALQIALADVTANFNKSVEKIAEQRTEIELLNANVTLLQVQQQVVTVDTTELDNKVLALQTNNTNLANDIITITNDRDQWKTLAENWYGVAMAQLKVMVNILGL